MDGLSNQGLGRANSDQNVESNENIDLGNLPRLNDLTDWELEQLEEQQRRGSSLQVATWLHHQPNSQPSQNTFITSQSLPQRQLDNYRVIGRVDDVLQRGRRPSTQAIGTPSTTGPGSRFFTPTNNVTSIDERLMQRPRPSSQSFLPFGTPSDRQIRYTDNGNHDEGRPPGLATPQGSSAATTISGPHTRGTYKQPSGSIPQQIALSVTGTDTSSGSKKVPKRQNSRSTDDEANGKYQLAKRYRSGHKNQLVHCTSTASSGPSRLPQQGTSVPLQTIEDTQESQRQTRNIQPLSASSGSNSSNVRKSGPVHGRPNNLVLPEDFIGACETCFFWLFDPKRLSSPERHACSGRKDEISHIVTHAADHHGLVRGRDPYYTARKYLTSCQTFDPFIKAKGNCGKCDSLHEWQGQDFSDQEHYGKALCLRCWRTFDKKGMQDHMAEPLCDYNAEQPKEKKVYILYTTFCSVTVKPSGPPKNMPPRKSNHRSVANKYSRTNQRQQSNNNQTQRRPATEQPTRDLRPAVSKAPHGQGKVKAPLTSTLSPATQDRPRAERPNQFPQQATRNPPNLQAAPPHLSSWQQQSAQQPAQPPIALMIYNTPPELVAGVVKTMQRNGIQEVTQSPYSPVSQATSFGGLQGGSPGYSFQSQQAHPQPQAQTQTQSVFPPSYPYSNWQPSFQQTPSQAFSQDPSQDGDLTRLQPASTQNNLSQQSFDPFLMHKTATSDRQGSRMQAPASMNSPMYNDGNKMLLGACFDAATADPNLFQDMTTPFYDRDAIVSLSDIVSQVQSTASRVPSTAGESMGLMQRSPKVEEKLWLDGPYDDLNNMNFDHMGSNPELRVTVEMVEPQFHHQPEEKIQNLKPEGQISSLLRSALEQDSGYSTQSGIFDGDPNTMFK
ncbi:uncharacterized protein FSUBG_4386 [Fusarium subglutinans]|uniref:Uncharacterized protein n=1 Tax=Gibberella subglutinans TaxID=42677 RepID=A0A8H5V2P0_GIBSU|nr:uncharacterized protein FSUBG_4386 [Fusarium subglutinans]KAF5608717.1 hypothetical protein FSUBG_4386 [Fusarium subglutinans]